MKTDLFIQVVSKEQAVTLFKLNNSTAAKELYAQLPLTITVEDYASKEKIFYPPKKLGTSNTPQADAKAGTLAYFAPWGDVVMFYKPFGSYRGLYELGEAISGGENISQLSGTLQLEKGDAQD
nr:cyclophilin-like fold protein [uncultured Desulfobulbus sp.]